MKIRLVYAVMIVSISYLFAHGRSEQMEEELNAPPPAWLSIGKPIKIEPLSEENRAQIIFRPRDGGATNSRKRVQIRDRGIEFEVNYPISWSRGTSLSPDGKKLIVNSGTNCHLYKIGGDGEQREVDIRLPLVTYDEGIKGYLREWSWAGNQTLVARSEITDEAGHEIIENRIYAFFMKERVLSRFDLSALNLPSTDDPEMIEVIEIGSNLKHLKIAVGNNEFTVKADLKSPAAIKDGENVSTEPRVIHSSSASPAYKAKPFKSVSKDLADYMKNIELWLLIAGGLLVLGVLLFNVSKNRKKPR